jgi:hypothetical protein
MQESVVSEVFFFCAVFILPFGPFVRTGGFRYNGGMAKIIGDLPQGTRRSLVSSLSARFSEAARLKADREDGEGLRRLAGVLSQLPDDVTAVLRPTLGFMQGECCLIGPGKVLVVQTLHFRGKIVLGQKEEWIGHPGSVDLGRPDRRAAVLCDRLAYSGNGRGFSLEPVVICTEGPVEFDAPAPLAPLVPWTEAATFLTQAFPGGVVGFDTRPLIEVLS